MSYREPTTQELGNPLWNAIWEVIKSWDINVPSKYSGYTGATGNHVCAIYDAVKANNFVVGSDGKKYSLDEPNIPG